MLNNKGLKIFYIVNVLLVVLLYYIYNINILCIWGFLIINVIKLQQLFYFYFNLDKWSIIQNIILFQDITYSFFLQKVLMCKY